MLILLFLTMVTGGILTLGVNLIPPRHGLPPTPGEPESYKTDRFQDTVDRVDASFQKSWSVENIQTALPAEELTIARRLSLGLMGTIPSLEEIRQFETQPSGERVNWWIDHILQDRRYADYLAERMARAFVGTEDGPFIFFRRRKFVAWLSEQITKGVPYDQVVREVIATEGLWTIEKKKSNEPWRQRWHSPRNCCPPREPFESKCPSGSPTRKIPILPGQRSIECGRSFVGSLWWRPWTIWKPRPPLPPP